MTEQNRRLAAAEVTPLEDRDDLVDVDKKLLRELTPKMIKGLLAGELAANAKKFSVKELLTIIRMAGRLAANAGLKERKTQIEATGKLAADELSAIMVDQTRSTRVAMHVEEFSVPELKIVIALALELEGANLAEDTRDRLEACRLLAKVELEKQEQIITLHDDDLIPVPPEGAGTK